MINAFSVRFHREAELRSDEIPRGTMIRGEDGEAGGHGFHHGEPVTFVARRENIEVREAEKRMLLGTAHMPGEIYLHNPQFAGKAEKLVHITFSMHVSSAPTNENR